MPNTPKDPVAPNGEPQQQTHGPDHPGKRPPKGPQPGRFDLHREGHRQGPGAGKGKRMIVPGKGGSR